MPPTTIFLIMCLLRYLPHKKPIRDAANDQHCKTYEGDNNKTVLFFPGFDDDGSRAHYVEEKSNAEHKTTIYSPIMTEHKKNRRFYHSWGQIYDCLQLIKFLKGIDFLNNNKIKGIVCHSTGCARFLMLYDLLKHQDKDFLNKAELNADEAKEIFNKMCKIKKCLVAPLLDLQGTIAFQLQRFHVPFSTKLSKLLCHYCMPFITSYKYDPHYKITPLIRLQNWSGSDFENFRFFYPKHDEMVGNKHVNWLAEKMNVPVSSKETAEIGKKGVTVFENELLDPNEKGHESSILINTAILSACKDNKKKTILF